jgi:hypothetical protein
MSLGDLDIYGDESTDWTGAIWWALIALCGAVIVYGAGGC